MLKSVPLVRASAFIPFVTWATKHHRHVEKMLSDCGLPHVWTDDGAMPVPFLAAGEFLDRLQREHGPDVGCRVVADVVLPDFGPIGSAVLSARNLREAYTRIAAAQVYNTSNAFYSIKADATGLQVQHGWNVPLPPTVLHVIESYTAGIAAALRRPLGLRRPVFERVSIIPHPVHGVAHLEPWLECEVVPIHRPPLVLRLSDAVADAPFPRSMAAATAPVPEGLRLNDLSMTESSRLVVRTMLRSGAPTIERMARYAGMSVRSYQRRLTAEGQTFSDLVEDERRRLLTQTLGDAELRLGEVATHLGYSRQSSLTRAVRRWTGKAPQRLRQSALLDREA